MKLTPAEEYAMRPYDGATFTFKDNPWIELPAFELANLIRQIQSDTLRMAVAESAGPFGRLQLLQLANELTAGDDDTPEIVCNIDPNDPNP